MTLSCVFKPPSESGKRDAVLSFVTQMALVRRPSCDLLPGAYPTTPPGSIWSERFALDAEVQEVLNTTPLMRMEDGKVKLDVASIERMSANSPAKQLLSRFRESLKNMNVAEYNTTDSAEDAPTGAFGINKRKREEPEENAKTDPEDIVRSFRVVSKKPRTETTEDESVPLQPFATHHETESKNMEVLCVPLGASALDRITLYDTNNKKLTRDYIDIPRNAYERMPMKHVAPGPEFKMLLVDGSGFKTGAHTTVQHAVRLAVHRKSCTNSWCRVLGCGNDPSYKLFCGVDERLKSDYERHWRYSCKHALRAHGHSLRMRADSA